MADPDAALNRWLDRKDDLLAGRKPRERRDGLAVADLVNWFLTVKLALVESDEMAQRTWNDYQATSGRMVEAFGRTRLVDDLSPEDFEQLRAKLSKKRGPVSLANEIQRVRSLCKNTWDASLIPKPVKFGPEFKKPSKKVRRKARAAAGPRMFSADEIRILFDSATLPIKAMILLGINAGFGNNDLPTLPLARVDLASS